MPSLQGHANRWKKGICKDYQSMPHLFGTWTYSKRMFNQDQLQKVQKCKTPSSSVWKTTNEWGRRWVWGRSWGRQSSVGFSKDHDLGRYWYLLPDHKINKMRTKFRIPETICGQLLRCWWWSQDQQQFPQGWTRIRNQRLCADNCLDTGYDHKIYNNFHKDKQDLEKPETMCGQLLRYWW